MAKPTWDETEEIGSTAPTWDDTEEAPSELASGIRGLTQGVTLGFGDEIQGGLEAFGQALGIKGLGANDFKSQSFRAPNWSLEGLKKAYIESRDAARASDAAAREVNPNSYMGGEFAGGIATSAIPGLNVAKGASLGKTALAAARQGAIAGLGQSEADNVGDAINDAAFGTAAGSAGGALGYGAGKLIEKGISKVGKVLGRQYAPLEGFAERRAVAALGGERGTVKKLGKDEVQDVGRYALDNGIVSPLSSTDEMVARNAKVMEEAMLSRKGAYDTIDEAAASTFNPLKVASKVEDGVVGGLNRSYDDTQRLIETLDPHLSNILSRGEGNIPLNEAQALVESLGKNAKFDTSRSNLQNQTAKDAYKIVREALNEAAAEGAESLGISGLRKRIEAANRQYSRGARSRDLLNNKYAREQGNKLLGLTDTIAGAGALPLGGLETAAVVGAKKGSERYGNQLMATGADSLAKLVKRAPEAFGKFGPVLQRAAARSAQSLAATHFVLQQINPEYRQLINSKQGADEEGQ